MLRRELAPKLLTMTEISLLVSLPLKLGLEELSSTRVRGHTNYLVFIGHDNLQHAGGNWQGYCLSTIFCLILEEVELKRMVATVYSTDGV